MNNLNIDWQKTLNIFKSRLEEFNLDKITYDSFFTTMKIQDIEKNNVILTIDTKWSYDFVIDYIEILEDI
ncbi:MAG: chromosomal replication initiator protein DnaA, partial [Erysipelotrichaceae bacterium]|nr:chromosomal replication initiator protein DnaA [Erysipelotrichaceae bacterium]